jgi:hypothetical protein
MKLPGPMRGTGPRFPYDDVDYMKKLGKGVKGLKVAFSPTLGYAARLIRKLRAR